MWTIKYFGSKKVLARKGNQLKVRWRDFDSWILKSDLVQIKVAQLNGT